MITLTYEPVLSRVTVDVSALAGGAEYAVIDRSVGGVTWTTVRGGSAADATSGAVLVYDYEFPDTVELTYRVRAYDSGDSLLSTETDTITVVLGAVWLKSPARPFLNRTVTVLDFGDITDPARGGVLEVLGRRLPVAVTEVRGSRRYELTLGTVDPEEARAVELFLSFGDVVFVHVPASCTNVPRSMYASVGDVGISRRSVYGPRRYFTLPLTEVAAPDAGIVGFTITWAGVVAAWATWGDLIADPAVPTWLDLQSYVSSPDDEIVG